MTTQPDAYVGHDGRLVARCPCGWWAAAEPGTPALVALHEHQKECEHPKGET